MKKNRGAQILWLFLVVFGCTKPAPANIVFEMDGAKIELETGAQKWTEASHNAAGNKGLVEYLLPDEKMETWSEMVTLNYFKAMEGEGVIQRLLDFTKKGIESTCQQVTWKVISQDQNRALYEWSARDCDGNPDQSEAAAAILKNKTLYVFHYASKQIPMDEAKKQEWLKRFERSKIS